MANINTIVSVTILASALAPSRASFGVPAIYAYHTHNLALSRTYSSLAGMIADGFTFGEPAVIMAQAILSQPVAPPTFKVIRCTSAVQQIFVLGVTNNTTGVPVGITMLDSTGLVRDLYVTPASQTTAAVATALGAIIAAVPGVASAVVAATNITVTITTAGNTWYPQLTPANSTNFMGGVQGLTFQDVTPTVGAATDLGNQLLLDPAWYGVSLQFISQAVIIDAAAWALANKRILSYVSADDLNLTAGTGVGQTMKNTSNSYAFGVFTRSPGQFAALGLMANRFTADPGTDTWDLKPVAAATPDDYLSPTQLQNITTNNMNALTTTAGLILLNDGRSGSGQFMDLTRGIDALQNDMQISVYGLLAAMPKVPYTQKGINAVAGAIAASLARFTASDSQPNALLSNDPGFAPAVIPPLVASVAQADKKARILRSMNWNATAAGAIHSVFIVGTISF